MSRFKVIDDRDTSWMTHGACVGEDPDYWFPERGDKDGAATAKRICATCPVRQRCLDYAIANHEQFGIWGGKAPNDRKAIRRARLERPEAS